MTKVNTSAEHRSEYRKLLLAKRSELLSGWRTRFDPPAERGRVAEDDRAPIFHEEFISARINRLDARQIELIDAALDRLEAGDYGICLECGGPISSKRLAAIPWASYCIVCQDRITSGCDASQPGICRTASCFTADSMQCGS